MTDVEQGKITFPCDFTFKIIGTACDEFEGEVLRILREHFPTLGEGAISLKNSKNGKYLAYSVVVQATSQAQLDATYMALSNNPLILFVL
jgi:putative lipoic acid-binding regulatory protein